MKRVVQAVKRSGQVWLSKLLKALGINGVFYNEVMELVSDHQAMPSVERYTVVLEGGIIQISDEANAPLLDDHPYYPGGRYEQKTVFLAALRAPKLNIQSGMLATSDNKLVCESDLTRERWAKNRLLHGRVKPAKRLSGRYTSIWHHNGMKYYHWILDCLPRTWVLKHWQGEKPHLIMPGSLPESYRRMLAWCAPDDMPITYLDDAYWVQPDYFVFPSFVTNRNSGYLPPEAREYLQARFYTAAQIDEERRYDTNIYISRSRAAHRRLTNESEITSLLKEYDFHIYNLEDTTVEEQVRLFYHARLVVAPHGAGLANLLFAGEKARVLELFGSRLALTWYLFLAESMQQTYFHLFARDLGNKGQYDDFSIDPNDLKIALQRLLRHEEA